MKGLTGFLQTSFKGQDFSKILSGITYPCWMPFYHGVCDKPLAHIKHLYPVKSVALFQKELDFYLEHFNIVSLSEIRNKPSDKPNLFLSFDDGLVEFNDVIAPILQKKGIPATVFLNSDFVDNKNLFFRYKASILATELESRSRSTNLDKSIKELLNISYHNSKQLDDLARDMSIDFEDYTQHNPIYLSTEQIKHWKTEGFDFGAHSKDHPLFEKLSLEEQLTQTTQCITELESMLGFTIESFSFPFTDYGVVPAFFEALKKAHPNLITFGTAGLKLDPINDHFQRLPMDNSTGDVKQYFTKQIQRYHLKKLAGKHIYKR